MNTQFKKTALILAGLLLIGTLAACDMIKAASDYVLPLTQFEQVCHQKGADKATAYDAAAGKIHPIVMYERSSDNAETYSLVSIPLLPSDWAVFGEENDPASVELVTCITRISEEYAGSCEFEDETDASITYNLEMYETSYDVKVFAATTGEELGSTTLDVEFIDDEWCPDSYTFPESGTDSYYAMAQGEALQEYLGQFVRP
jgi:hypothetical protein